MRILWIFTFLLISTAYADSPNLHDRVYRNNHKDIQNISLYISHVNSKLSHTQTLYLAYHIVQKSLKRKLDPSIVASIIAVESHYNINAYNASGDYSLAQINYKTWTREFKRLGYDALNKTKLKTDITYAIDKMTHILSIVKKRSTNDSRWYTKYHSSTPKLRKRYEKKLEKELLVLTHLKSNVNIASNDNIGGL